MYPILVKLGPLTFYSYGFMLALGFFVGIMLTVFYARREGIDAETVMDASLAAIVGGIIGARLFYVAGQWQAYKNSLWEIFMLQNGGLVFLGGFIFSVLGVGWVVRRRGVSVLKFLDAASPGVALGYAIGRVGCFLNGCCFGLPANVPWAVVSPDKSLAAFYFPHEVLHPTQIYSSLGMLLVFIILALFYSKKRFNGQVFFLWIWLYSLYRFTVEFFRFSPIYWWGLTPSQWMVIVAVILAGWGFIYFSQTKRV